MLTWCVVRCVVGWYDLLYITALEDQVQRLTDLRQELKILTTQTQSALQQGEQLHSEISNTQQNIHQRKEGIVTMEIKWQDCLDTSKIALFLFSPEDFHQMKCTNFDDIRQSKQAHVHSLTTLSTLHCAGELYFHGGFVQLGSLALWYIKKKLKINYNLRCLRGLVINSIFVNLINFQIRRFEYTFY